MGIIYPVRHSKWATPIIPVPKPNNEIRICADCKVTLNKYLRKDHYPLPRLDDLFANLAGTKYFCVLDLRDAFQQVAIAKDSQELFTVNTHIGLFRYKRLFFGISIAPTLFQSVMDEALKGIKSVFCFIDDVLIGGKTISECIENVKLTMNRFKEFNIRVKIEKCKFFQREVKYLGHIITGVGIRPNPEKVRAIMEAPRPKDITQLKSYLGLINYYGKFLPNLSTELAPLYGLTKKNVTFEWSSECEGAFEKSKILLLNNQLLIHYDPNKEIAIFCDASPYGLGAILSHIIDKEDKPVLFSSCMLTDTQKNYPQLHREALAIVFAVSRFHKYIAGKSFTIYSDHQPLREIFNENKTIPIATLRLQKWAIFLASYDYSIKYKKGSKLANADALSKLPIGENKRIEHININSFSENIPIEKQLIARETRADSILGKIYSFVMTSWPENRSGIIKHYFNKRLMLSAEDGCLFYDKSIIIPNKLQVKVLDLLHSTHIGIVRMKLLAKNYVWWLNINEDIENYAKSCETCQLNQHTPSKVKLNMWKETTFFFERIHLDFFHFASINHLIIVDTYSRWIDIKIMKTTNGHKLIEELRSVFVYFGLPKTLVADNGPPFNSALFANFCKNNGICYLNSPPYHPQSNGWAERGVRTTKEILKKMHNDPKTCNMTTVLKIQNYLIKYRNTPVTTTGVTPNDRIFSFSTRTMLDVLNEKKSITTVQKPITTVEKKPMDTEIFKPKDTILYRSVGNNKVTWIKGMILKQISKSLFEIRVDNGRTKICHGDQIRKFNIKTDKSHIIHSQSQIPIERENENVEITAETKQAEAAENTENVTFERELSDSEHSEDNQDNEETVTPTPTTTESVSARQLRQKPSISYYEPRNRKPSTKKN